MKYIDTKKILEWSKDLNGVFSMSDLKVLFGEVTESALYKKLNALIEEKFLVKVIRGLYATPEASLEEISNRINPASYISMGTVLAKNIIIGSVPGRKVQAVTVGRPRIYECELGIIEHLSIAPRLFCGFQIINGVKYADSEKAFLDTWYFFYKGKQFSFDLDSDINKEALNSLLISKYLKKYDTRFVSFFKRSWNYE